MKGAQPRGSARPVPPRHDRKTDRDRTGHRAWRRVFQGIAEAKAAAAPVRALGTTLRCAGLGGHCASVCTRDIA
ncbi:hypothetical protein F01_460206 [Burkholderia cenocepacia]|nr:hypothetical protein F01_460206 [Burkholderia cenocepacia]